MKKIFKIFFPLFVGIVFVFGIAGCSKSTNELSEGTFYSLQEAYDHGWLTQGDLQIIANYHNNGIPYPEILSEDTAKSIKKDWAQKLTNDNPDSGKKITEEDIDIQKYYGTYNECAIIIVDLIDANYIDVDSSYTIEIDNVTFNFMLYRPKIIVWKIKNI